MQEQIDQINITSLGDVENIHKLHPGTLIEGFSAENGGYWHVDPIPLAEAAAKRILEDTQTEHPSFHSQAAVVLYAVKEYDFKGMRSLYERQHQRTWEERIQKYQTPKSEKEAEQIARTLAWKEYKASDDEPDISDFEAYIKEPQTNAVMDERISRFQEKGLSKEEALMIAPHPGTSDAGSGLFRGADLPPLHYRPLTEEEITHRRSQLERQLRAEGRHPAADKVHTASWTDRVTVDMPATRKEEQSWRRRIEQQRNASPTPGACMIGM